jgi:hypothetical protein
MTREQKIVAVGAVSGIAAMVLAMWFVPGLLPQPAEADILAGRLAYALRWAAVAALLLFLMVAAIGNARFKSEAIDPTRGFEDRTMLINGGVTDNTLQQFALFLAGSLGLAASLSPRLITVIGAAAIVFATSRILFWIGYRIDPLYRAFGFA